MNLQALDGIGDVDATAVVKERVLETLKRLPNGDVKDILSELPEDVVRELCKRGITDELEAVIPSILVAGIAGSVVYLLSESIWPAILGGISTGVAIYPALKS